MTELNEIESVGIAPKWRKRKAIVKDLRANVTAYSMQGAMDYNARTDQENDVNVVHYRTYRQLGRHYQFETTALLLDEKPWLLTLANSTANRLFADKLQYFWHHQFAFVFPDHPDGLHMFSFADAVVCMADAFILGWEEEAIYQGYLVHAVLNHNYYLFLEYEEHHRRSQSFMLRLFADWRGDISHQWPPYAYDEPIYNGLLERWRDPDPQNLVPWLMVACDRHTHQAGRETSKVFYDFGDIALMRAPLEILMLFRLREMIGLSNPKLDHPLMEAPYDQLPAIQPKYQVDEYMEGTLKRARQDWPNFDQVVSLENVKSV